MKYLFPAKEMCIMGDCNIVVHVLSIAWNKLHLQVYIYNAVVSAIYFIYAGLLFEKSNYFVGEGDGFVEVCGNLYGKQGLTVAVRFYTGSVTTGGTFK